MSDDTGYAHNTRLHPINHSAFLLFPPTLSSAPTSSLSKIIGNKFLFEKKYFFFCVSFVGSISSLAIRCRSWVWSSPSFEVEWRHDRCVVYFRFKQGDTRQLKRSCLANKRDYIMRSLTYKWGHDILLIFPRFLSSKVCCSSFLQRPTGPLSLHPPPLPIHRAHTRQYLRWLTLKVHVRVHVEEQCRRTNKANGNTKVTRWMCWSASRSAHHPTICTINNSND